MEENRGRKLPTRAGNDVGKGSCHVTRGDALQHVVEDQGERINIRPKVDPVGLVAGLFRARPRQRANELRALLQREPFRPVRVRFGTGDAGDILEPNLAVVMRTRLFLASPESERWTVIPFLHISAVEPLTNGNSG